MKSQHSRLEWIDSIRAFAAIFVMALHLWGIAYANVASPGYIAIAINWSVYGIADIGKIGVIIFFAVSGFVIPFSLLRGSANNLPRFIISRIFRLYPIYWVSIFIAVVIFGYASSSTQLVANITMFQKFIGFDDIVGLYWTLQIELVFYILCAILFLFNTLNKDRTLFRNMYFFIAVALLMAVARYITQKKLPVAMPLSLSVMFFGFIWRKYLLSEGSIRRGSIIICLAVFFAALVPVTLLAYNSDMGFDERWYRYFATYLAALSIFIFFTRVFTVKNAVAAYLGKISYSIYLLHGLIGRPILEYLLQYKAVSPYIMLSASALFVVAVSSVTYYIIEKPFIELSRRINRRYEVAAADRG